MSSVKTKKARRLQNPRQRLRGLAATAFLCTCIAYAQNGHSQAQKHTEIVHVDEEIGFIMLDEVRETIKQGDSICILLVKTQESICQIEPKIVQRKQLFFPAKSTVSKFESGMKVILSRVYVKSNSKGIAGKTVAPLSEIKAKLFQEKRENKISASVPNAVQTAKAPKSNTLAIEAENPEMGGNDFPEIFIPKIKKRRVKKEKKQPSQTDILVKSLKKVFRKQGTVKYRFEGQKQGRKKLATTGDVPVEIEEQLPDDFSFINPDPLTHVLDVTFFQTLPIVPITNVKSVKFSTITNDTLERSELWAQGKQTLTSSLGAGFEVNFTRSATEVFSLGYRYHLFEKAKTLSTFDQSVDNIYSETKTEVDTHALHVEWGKQNPIVGRWYQRYAFGLELFQSAITFKANTVNTATEKRELQAFAESSFGLIALRSHYSWKFQLGAFSFSTGAIASIPVALFKETFEGEISEPERVNYTGLGADEIKEKLEHKQSPIGAEIYFGINYQPQR